MFHKGQVNDDNEAEEKQLVGSQLSAGSRARASALAEAYFDPAS